LLTFWGVHLLSPRIRRCRRHNDARGELAITVCSHASVVCGMLSESSRRSRVQR
jgi:hypothetical protein